MKTNNPEYLYIHIPFCKNICSYCDFYKMIAKPALIKKYFSYLKKELLLKKEELSNIEYVYIGGGTPTSVGYDNLSFLFSFLKENLSFPLKEFTIEANPLDITPALVSLFKINGITRISLGVQSLDGDTLSMMHRRHRKSDVINCLKLLNDDFPNINIDLIFGFPNDSFLKLKKTIKLLSKYKAVKHFSVYSLIIEDKTILNLLYQKHEFIPLDQDLEASIYLKTCRLLNRLGFRQYEISNFAKAGYMCLYNLNTWKTGQYSALGASSSSYLNNYRSTTIMNLNKYFSGIDNNMIIYKENMFIDLKQMMEEEVILGLRLKEGISVALFAEKYQRSIFDVYPKIKSLIKAKFLRYRRGRLSIPQNKLYVSSAIINEII